MAVYLCWAYGESEEPGGKETYVYIYAHHQHSDPQHPARLKQKQQCEIIKKGSTYCCAILCASNTFRLIPSTRQPALFLVETQSSEEICTRTEKSTHSQRTKPGSDWTSMGAPPRGIEGSVWGFSLSSRIDRKEWSDGN